MLRPTLARAGSVEISYSDNAYVGNTARNGDNSISSADGGVAQLISGPSLTDLRQSIASTLMSKFGKSTEKSDAIAALISDSALKDVRDSLEFITGDDSYENSHAGSMIPRFRHDAFKAVKGAMHHSGPTSPFRKAERLEARAKVLEALGESYKNKLPHTSTEIKLVTKDFVIAADLLTANNDLARKLSALGKS